MHVLPEYDQKLGKKANPADTARNDNVIITSKRRNNVIIVINHCCSFLRPRHLYQHLLCVSKIKIDRKHRHKCENASLVLHDFCEGDYGLDAIFLSYKGASVLSLFDFHSVYLKNHQYLFILHRMPVGSEGAVQLDGMAWMPIESRLSDSSG